MADLREALKAKLAALRPVRDQHVANANAVGGAIQVLEELLKADEEEQKPSGDDTPHLSP